MLESLLVSRTVWDIGSQLRHGVTLMVSRVQSTCTSIDLGVAWDQVRVVLPGLRLRSLRDEHVALAELLARKPEDTVMAPAM